jgi:D-sedoheptulose 7-phosphate isomerase
MVSFPATYRQQLIDVINRIDVARVDQAIDWLKEARQNGRAVFVAGNGGSAATASHFVCDMVKGASFKKPSRFRITALGQNLPTLTAYSNDVAYQDALVEELKNFAQPGDVVLVISCSGNSPNVVRLLEHANAAGLKTVALTGRDGGKLGSMAQLHIHVADPHFGRIEDAHHIICHMMCYHFMDTEN